MFIIVEMTVTRGKTLNYVDMNRKRNACTMNFVLLLFSLMWNEKEGAAANEECNFVVNNTLKSPGFPKNYPSNVDCTVTLPIPNEMTMKITFVYFDVEFSQPTCRYDYLKINSSSGNEVHTYCGQKTGTTVFVAGEYVEIVFHSDQSKEKSGFLLQFAVFSNGPPRITSLDPAEPIIPGDQVLCSTAGSHPIYTAIVKMDPFTVLVNTTDQASVKVYHGGNYSCVATSKYGIDRKDFPVIDCGPVINGTLTSPGYLGGHPRAMHCGSSVTIPRGMQMQIYFIDFDLEDSDDCNRDYLNITNEKNQGFGVYCGQGSGNEINVTGTSVFITFHTENATQSRGFKLHLKSYVAGCGVVNNNTLTSPGYPDNYPSDTDCLSFIPIPQNMQMKIYFADFDLEDSKHCGWDSLRIRNEMNHNFGFYCGEKTGEEVLVTGQYAFMVFHSDASHEKRGFKMHFTPVPFDCGSVINNTLRSPGYPIGYPSNLDCNYSFPIPPNAQMQILIKDLHLEDHASCSHDFLQIKRKVNQKSVLLTTICGQKTNYQVPISGDFVLLRFHTDNKNEQRGFDIDFILKSPGYPKYYPNNTDCDYLVYIPQEMTMNITFIDFKLEESSECSFDYVKIIDDEGTVVGKFCGGQTGKILLLTGEFFSITFHSDYNREERGFHITFTAVSFVQPRITSLDLKVPITPNNQVSCLAIGTPPIYTSIVHKQTSAVLINTTDSAIIRLYEDGNYSCIATSKYGTDTAEFLVKGCGPVVNDTLKSPGYPENYPANMDCTSAVPIPQGQEMEIYLSQFELEDSQSCARDFLTITNEANRVFGVYCGQKSGEKVIVNGSYALMIFHTDSDIQRRGFWIHFSTLPILKTTIAPKTESIVHKTESIQTTISVQSTKMSEIKADPSQVNATSSGSIMIIYIVAGVASSLFLLLCLALSCWYYKVKQRKINRRSALSLRKIVILDKWEILPEQIEYKEELGRGAFGIVYKGTLRKRAGIDMFLTGKKSTPKEASQEVAVKVLPDNPREEQKQAFLHEISQMKLLGSHPSIVSLVGCCTLQDTKFLVIEYVPYGDLLQWLRRNRRLVSQNQVTDGKEKEYEDKEICISLKQTNESGQQDFQTSQHQEHIELQTIPPNLQKNCNAADNSTENLGYDDDDETDSNSFTADKLFSFAWQIAQGMNHLAEKDFVHRDLAARNILVGRDGRVKVSDFGLMRQMYEDVYSLKKTKKLPVKWMAPESIFDSIFSTKSDVWSYGILLWEMVTMGGVPYPTLTNSEVCRLLKTGYRMERPDMCSDEVYELMTECWTEEPATRPSFSQLVEKLELIISKDTPYIDFSKHDESNSYYNIPTLTNDEDGS
ncbi:hypothetical protein pdam_00013942 [Pocillopora damicornis]|uniref:Receptor protein-tyrosine kinase n=1 Tax=Pocillopora damicornis TaxID=46731 RepID=A0A3M6U8F5_POCDA|nr:hypothetical protein pdam_00013942 [Pocillopora damicornis]